MNAMRSIGWRSNGICAGLVMTVLAVAALSGCRDRTEQGSSRAANSRTATAAARARLTADGDGGLPDSGAGDLVLKNAPYSPIRIVEGPDGGLYVTDTATNSMFIYRNLLPEAELKGLAKPLGVAIDGQANIYVGLDDRRTVEVYDSSGIKQRELGGGEIQMPNDLAIDRSGNLYVADSRANAVKVFDPAGALLRTIGNDRLDFPVALALGYRGPSAVGELYVVDQAHAAIQIFDFAGTFLRTFGTLLELGETAWHGKFVQPQSIAVDAQGRLHVLDIALNCIQVFDPDTGIFLDFYGQYGTAEGQFNVPLDIAITRNNQVMIANTGNHRIELIRDLNR